ncbi:MULTISPECIES: ribosome-binding factor A [Hymenobacter]|uniref:Ribosome-binding factor A n=1 Tax=Hymenobacter jejuensis TaxID=2502781 RepID=A0A5B7ZZ81_9BACT|nr:MULTISPECIES: ribosome-binding factor A [Hymenobacter]MBC6991830.1 ribosome-binding factor A [Hymenobacter sp. BT491]QDA60147.1 ribosome-binding factor A [Hymenobacter jejuensis]
MESKRQQKVASLLQQELAAVFQRDLPHLFPGLAPGISTVRVSPDLGVARVYLSLLIAGNAEGMLAEVRDNAKTIRLALAKRVRQQLRIVPDLAFYLDDSAAYAARMDQVFSGLNIPPSQPEDPDKDQPDSKRPKLFADEDEE